MPVPFLSVFACVVFAGAAGGRLAGLIAAAFAVLFVGRAYLDGIGPPTLTGSLPVAIAGMLLYLAAGYLLGRITDQRDRNLSQLVISQAHEKELMEQALRHSEARFEQALNVARIGVWIWDLETDRCTYCSEINAAINGLTPQEYIETCHSAEGGMTLVRPDNRASYMRAVESVWNGATINHDYVGLTKDGESIFIHETMSPIREESGRVVKLLGTSVDMTALHNAESMARRSQRMEAIGNLTAGIAHDFNNLLAVIQGNLELVEMRTSDRESMEMIADAIQATRRGADLTGQLLAFGRRSTLRPTLIDASAVVDGMSDLFRRTLPAPIQLQTDLSEDLPSIEVDRTQVESAILNLVINARDAMPNGGKLTIRTASVRSDGANGTLGEQSEIASGRYVMIAVLDTGSGMSPDVLEKACEPFFTTKGPARGTGLGLAMVYGFTMQSGGHFQLSSEPGAGTEVKLFFPEASAADRPGAPKAPGSPEERSQAGTVLVVEDTEGVRKVVVTQLRRLGYRVRHAENGAEALAILRSGQDVDLLLTDIVMPGEVQGPELAEIAMREMPDLKVIIMSGYPGNTADFENAATRDLPRLTKPISMNKLDAVLRRELKNARKTT